jgi:uncharacterized membrane protein
VIVWGSPAWLAALALVAALALFERSRTRAAPAGIAVRALVGALTATALAQPARVVDRPEVVDVVVVDRSASVAASEVDRALRDGAVAGAALVLVGQSAIVAARAGEPWPSEVAPEGDATDLAAGLALAASLVPLDRPGRVALWSDGRDTIGRDVPDLARLAVETHPLRPAPTDEPAILFARTQRTDVAAGATLLVDVSVAGAGALEIRHGAEVLATLDASGDVSVPVSIPLDAPTGVFPLDVAIGSAPATRLAVLVRAPPRVLIVTADRKETRALERALAAENVAATVVHPSAVPALDAVDLVVLADTATHGAGALPAALVASLDGWVRAGGGLLAVGGENAFDLGGWRGSPLADLLPVSIDPAGPQQQAAVSLVLAIDKSGSMALGGAGAGVASVGTRLSGGRPTGSKIRLVTEAMGAAIERLRGSDRVGVLAIDTEARWAIPLQPALPKEPLLAKVGRMTSGGGGIYIATALGVARDALAADTAPIRHVVLFADTNDAGEERALDGVPVLEVVREMAESGITISVIGVGQPDDADAPFLAELATNARGRFLLASASEDLKTLFVDEAERMIRRSLEEQPYRARVEALDPSIEGLSFAAAPALASRNRVGPRERAKIVLTADGAPLLAVWQVGLGRVAAWTSDAGGRWSAAWTPWSGYQRFWTQLVRTTARASGERSPLEIAPAPGGVEVRLLLRDAEDRSLSLGGRRLEVHGIDTPLALAAPGLYAAFVPAAPGAVVSARVLDAGTVVAERSGVAAPSEERRWRSADEDRLRALAHAAPTTPAHPDAQPLWRGLLWLAVLLLPIDALLRRPLRR